MSEKILAKDAQLGSIYLTRGGKQLDDAKKECLWGFHPVQVLRYENGPDGSLKRVIVYTPWGTELVLNPDYPLETTDLQTLPVETVNPVLINTTKVSDENAPEEYVQKLKEIKKEQPQENSSKEGNKPKTKFECQQILEELKKGTPVKEMAKILKLDYRVVYGHIQQLKKKFKIQKVGKGIFQLMEK